MSRAFDDTQLRTMETGASDEVAGLCAEVRRLYAAEDAQQGKTEMLTTLLLSTHQNLQATGRTLENALRLLAPPQPKQAPQGDGRRIPSVMMDEQLSDTNER